MKSPSSRLIPILALSTLSTLLSTPAGAQSTINPAKQHSWAANTGFINWHPNQPLPSGGAVVNEFFLSGKIYSANLGWIDLGDGGPNNAIQYSNLFPFDCGVNMNPATGALTGFAYGANIGWINFEQTHGKPAINLATGEFTGHAWSANTGWINLGDGQLATVKLICTDNDADGMSDQWERLQFGDMITAGFATDSDGDGATDLQEYHALTDPQNAADFLNFIAQSYSDTREAMSLTFSSVPGRLYTVQTSIDLETWINAAGHIDFPGNAVTTITNRSVSVGISPRYFFRVLVKKPLQP